MAMLNVVSLLLGFTAMIIPLTQSITKTSSIKIISSFSCCLIAIACQIAYQTHLVTIQNWSAVADTIGSVLFASILLITLTILTNLASLLKVKKQIIHH